jgi:hypothetical protein
MSAHQRHYRLASTPMSPLSSCCHRTCQPCCRFAVTATFAMLHTLSVHITQAHVKAGP